MSSLENAGKTVLATGAAGFLGTMFGAGPYMVYKVKSTNQLTTDEAFEAQIEGHGLFTGDWLKTGHFGYEEGLELALWGVLASVVAMVVGAGMIGRAQSKAS